MSFNLSEDGQHRRIRRDYDTWLLQGLWIHWYPYVTADVFVSEPMIRGSFFQYGLRLVDEALRFKNRVDQDVFSVRSKSTRSNVILSCQLRDENGDDLAGQSYYQRQGGDYTFLYSPDLTSEHKAVVFGSWKGLVGANSKIPALQFERALIPRVAESVSEGTLTVDEQDAFVKAFVKVENNGSHYFLEDQFAVARNEAVIRVSDALGLAEYWMEPVLSIDVQRAIDPVQVTTFPDVFGKYHELTGTQLIEPVQHRIRAGEAVQFRIKSSDSLRWAVILNGSPQHFQRERDGTLSLRIVTPVGASELIVWSSLDGRSYAGIFRFILE